MKMSISRTPGLHEVQEKGVKNGCMFFKYQMNLTTISHRWLRVILVAGKLCIQLVCNLNKMVIVLIWSGGNVTQPEYTADFIYFFNVFIQ